MTSPLVRRTQHHRFVETEPREGDLGDAARLGSGAERLAEVPPKVTSRPVTTSQLVGGTTWGPSACEPVQVLLCEDHQVYLAGLRTLLDGDPGISVVAVADNTQEACRLTEQHHVQVVVVRQGLLLSPQYEPLQDMTRRGIAVLVLAESDSEIELARALRAGARGYLSRRLSGGQLLHSIRALARHEPAFDAAVAQHLVSYLVHEQTQAAPPADPRTVLDHLTNRQRAVATLVAEGLTNDEIAARLHLSRTTVKSHLATAMRRLELRSRTQLAIAVNRESRAQG